MRWWKYAYKLLRQIQGCLFKCLFPLQCLHTPISCFGIFFRQLNLRERSNENTNSLRKLSLIFLPPLILRNPITLLYLYFLPIFVDQAMLGILNKN